MNKVLHFTKQEYFGFPIRKINAFPAFIVSMILMIWNTSTVKAQQTSVEIPNTNVSGSFIGPTTNSSRVIQLIIDDSQLTALNGKYLTSIAFRLSSTASANWPASTATFPTYEIFLSNGVDPANRQLDFTANIVGTQTQVRAGSLVIPAGAFTSGGNPNDFSFNIVFDTPWLYSGTNLVIEIRHTGSDSTSQISHAASPSSSGYGTLYSACWATSMTNTVNQANFTYVKINAENSLGISSSVEIDSELSIYPNPVKDVLEINSSAGISELSIFNFTGQKIYSAKHNGTSAKINVESWQKGTYILQLTDKNSNTSSRKFIKK